MRCRRGKRDAGLCARRNAQHHAQSSHGVQPRFERGGCIRHTAEQGQRPGRRVVAPQPELAVGLVAQAQHIPFGIGHKVRRLQGGFGLQAGGTHKPQRLLRRQPIGGNKKVGKRGVGLVGRMGGQGDVQGRDQLQLNHLVTQVAHHHLAQFDVVLRAHPHRGVHPQPRPQRIKTHAVGMEAAAVHRARIGRGVAGDGRGHAGARLPDVDEAAVRIAQGIVAPAADARLVPAAPSRPVGAQRNAVAPVAQQVRGLQRLGAWRHGTHMVVCFLLVRMQRQVRWHGEQGGQLARGALLQQRQQGLNACMRHTPALRHATQEHIGQRHDGHALVVGHVGADQREPLAMGLAFGREVQRLAKTIASARRQRGQPAEVVAGRARIHLGGQRRGIRGNHQLAQGRAAQGQAGRALRGVLVRQGVVAHGISAFGNAPGHVLAQALHLRHVFAQGGSPGLAQGTVVGLGDHQRRHEVLEHRARPRAQHRVVTVGKKRPPQGRPVLHGQVALGHGQQAGGARLGREQIVERGVQLLLIHPVTDV